MDFLIGNSFSISIIYIIQGEPFGSPFCVLRVFFLVVLYDLGSDVAGNGIVARNLVLKATAALRHRAQNDRILGKLGLGCYGVNRCVALLALGGIHTHNRATALVQVTHHVAHERIGNGNVKVTNRLEKHGSGLLQALLVRQRCSGLKEISSESTS